MLEGSHTFFTFDPATGLEGYPAMNLQDNGDGTYVGNLDLDKMSPTRKLMALARTKYNAINEKLGLSY